MENPLKAIDRMGMTIRIDNKNATPALTKNLQRISPEELHFAFLLKCADIVNSDPSEETISDSRDNFPLPLDLPC